MALLSDPGDAPRVISSHGLTPRLPSSYAHHSLRVEDRRLLPNHPGWVGYQQDGKTQFLLVTTLKLLIWL